MKWTGSYIHTWLSTLQFIHGVITYDTDVRNAELFTSCAGTLDIATYSPVIATLPAEPLPASPKTLADVPPYMIYPIKSEIGIVAWNTPGFGNTVVLRVPSTGEIFPGSKPASAYELAGPFLCHVRDVTPPTAESLWTLDRLWESARLLINKSVFDLYEVINYDGQVKSSGHRSINAARAAATEIARKQVTT